MEERDPTQIGLQELLQKDLDEANFKDMTLFGVPFSKMDSELKDVVLKWCGLKLIEADQKENAMRRERGERFLKELRELAHYAEVKAIQG